MFGPQLKQQYPNERRVGHGSFDWKWTLVGSTLVPGYFLFENNLIINIKYAAFDWHLA